MTLATKPVVRETLALSRRHPLVATMTAHSLLLREKGRPSTQVEVPYDAAFSLGWKLKERESRAARDQKKRAGRAQKRTT